MFAYNVDLIIFYEPKKVATAGILKCMPNKRPFMTKVDVM